MKFCLAITAVMCSDLHEDIVRSTFSVLNKYIEVAIVIKHARIDQFVFHLISTATRIFCDEFLVGKSDLRVFEQHFQIRMGGCGVEVVVAFLDIFAVVTLLIRQAKCTFFEDRIFSIPESQGDAELLIGIADAANAIFPPAISPRACHAVRKIIPGIARGAIVFPYGAPLPLTEVRTPVVPVLFTEAICFESCLFCVHGNATGFVQWELVLV